MRCFCVMMGYQSIGSYFSYRLCIWYLFGWILISLTGSMFHFTYQWSGCNWAVGLLVAVNESVFEHVKILVLPILLFWFIDCIISIVCHRHRVVHCIAEYVIAANMAVYSGVFFLIVVYLVVSVGIGYDSLWFDILLFVLSAFVSQITGAFFLWLIQTHNLCRLCAPMSVVTLILAVVGHMLFTDYPPNIPVFFKDNRGFYGRPVVCYVLIFPSLKNEPQNTTTSFQTTVRPTTTPSANQTT